MTRRVSVTTDRRRRLATGRGPTVATRRRAGRRVAIDSTTTTTARERRERAREPVS